MNNILCTICLDEEIRCNDKTECDHFFHKTCLDLWFRENDTCPFCRKNVRPHVLEVNDEESYARYLDNMTVQGAAELDSSFDSEYDLQDYIDDQGLDEELRMRYEQDLYYEE